MTHKPDGGPAFPTMDGTGHPGYNGMNLRDWFAGQALAGLCANETEEDRDHHEEDPVAAALLFAVQAYMMADAMLFVRKKEDAA